MEDVFQTLRNTLSGFCPKSGQEVLKGMCPRLRFVFKTWLQRNLSWNTTSPILGSCTTLDRIKSQCPYQTCAFQHVLFHTVKATSLNRQPNLITLFETLLLCTWSVIQSNSFHVPPHVLPRLGYSPPLGFSLLSTSIPPHSCLLASDATQNPAPWTNSSSSLSLHLEPPSAPSQGM